MSGSGHALGSWTNWVITVPASMVASTVSGMTISVEVRVVTDFNMTAPPSSTTAANVHPVHVGPP